MLFDKIFKLIQKRHVDVDTLTADLIDDRLPAKSQLQDFMNHPVWKYITDTVAYRIKSSRDDLENQQIDIETVRVFQGRLEELRFIVAIPSFLFEQHEAIAEEVKARKKDKKQEDL